MAQESDTKPEDSLRNLLTTEIEEVLGLSPNWKDGTYFYALTRVKEAFAVGTMSLDDFTEVDDQLVQDLLTAVLKALRSSPSHEVMRFIYGL